MKFMLTMAVLFGSLMSFAQARQDLEEINSEEDEKSNSSFILKIGAGLPNGGFGDENDGVAEPGVLFEGEYQQGFNDFFYISFLARFQRNNIDDDIFASAIKSELASNGLYGIDVLVSSRPWKVQSYMVGFGSSTPLENKSTHFMTQFALGYVSLTSPNLVISLSEPNYTEITTQEDATEGAVAFRFGLGLKVEASEEIDVLFSADYFNTSVDFTNVPISSTAGVSDQVSFKQDVELINLSVGIVFKL